jgi:hypothetical protein
MIKLAFLLTALVSTFYTSTDTFIPYGADPNHVIIADIDLQDGKNTISITGSTKATSCNPAHNTKMTCEFVDPFAAKPIVAIIKDTYKCKVSTTIALPEHLLLFINNTDKDDAYYNVHIDHAN